MLRRGTDLVIKPFWGDEVLTYNTGVEVSPFTGLYPGRGNKILTVTETGDFPLK